jgi:hypothetical protein
MQKPTLLTFWSVIVVSFGHLRHFVESLHVCRKIFLVDLLLPESAENSLMKLEEVISDQALHKVRRDEAPATVEELSV